MRNGNAKNKSVKAANSCDLRGTAYISEAASPFKGNGVCSTSIVGGDLRTRGAEKK